MTGPYSTVCDIYFNITEEKINYITCQHKINI